MKRFVFVRTTYQPEYARMRANLAFTRLRRGGHERKYSHSLNVFENHLVSARCWVIDNMPLIPSEPVGFQSGPTGDYIFAFEVD